MVDASLIGKQINIVRKERGITGDALSELCHINAAYLRQIECGRRVPSLPVFIDLCNSLEVSPCFLLKSNLKKTEQRGFDLVATQWETATPKQIELVLAMI